MYSLQKNSVGYRSHCRAGPVAVGLEKQRLVEDQKRPRLAKLRHCLHVTSELPSAREKGPRGKNRMKKGTWCVVEQYKVCGSLHIVLFFFFNFYIYFSYMDVSMITTYLMQKLSHIL